MACEVCPIPDIYDRMSDRTKNAEAKYTEQKKKLGEVTLQRLDTPGEMESEKSVADYLADVDRAARVEDALHDAVARSREIDCATKDIQRLHLCPRLLYLNYEVDQTRRIDPGLDAVMSGIINPDEA